MQERKHAPVQRAEIVLLEEKGKDLPRFDLAKLKLSEAEIKQVKKCLLLEEEINSLTKSQFLKYEFSD